ncbi:MAG: carbohydrate binding domain-containing protein [Armatimonadetes bacterium]|nr:carbohydrate binding domain-containing protein [Armatimonadota bacterium]
MRKTALAIAALALALAGTDRAQTPAAPAASPSMFPFVIPWDDATPGTATDVSFLNTKPAGAHGYIVPRGGHFVESGIGKRVRFLAVNLAAGSAFPDHADAEKVAARLAKYGVNLVRLHHMDNVDWGPTQHIWDDSYKDRRHISPAQLDKLDYLIAQLKKNGVYANINLHVSRQFSAADGFPPSVEKIPFGYDKRVDNYDRRMIALQKEYARQLLTHVNPYTHLSYASDPCVAVVEINNENSLMGDPWGPGFGSDLDALPEPFRGELVGLWNDWLTKKYGTDARLRAAWLKGVTPPGPAINTYASWTIEHQGTSEAALSPQPQAGGSPDAIITVTQIDDTGWHVQAHQTGLNFRDGATYTVSFRAKADAPRAMNVAAGLDQADWHNIGLSADADLTTDWKTFRYVFTAHEPVPRHGRVAFQLGDKTGTVWISDLQVRPGAEGAGLLPGQSLAARTVDMPVSTTRNQHEDWLLFLADTERAYADGMRDYLKHDLHVHANVIDSQLGFGGLSSVNREAGSDFADAHAYWQHPSFPHRAWDPVDWNIPNTPMVADLASGGGGTLRDLAAYRIAGRPYSVSEYNHPAPNDYQAETVPVLASFAAFQDWDMIYLFDYGAYGAQAANDKIQGYFGVGSNPAKMAFFPAAALIFRAGEMPPAVGASVLGAGPSGWKVKFAQGVPDAARAWQASGRPPAFLNGRLALGLTRSTSVTQGNTHPATVLKTVKTSAGARYVADSPNAVAIVGFVGGQTVTTHEAQFLFRPFGNNFVAVTLTPLDGRPIAQSRHMLLTLAGKVENQDMRWNAARTSVGDRWGHGPTMAEGIPATVTLPHMQVRRVYALDATGRRTQEVGPARVFDVGPQYKTVWYELTE